MLTYIGNVLVLETYLLNVQRQNFMILSSNPQMVQQNISHSSYVFV